MSSLLLFVVVALFSVTLTIVLQKVLQRTFVIVQMPHSNDFGSLSLCSPCLIGLLPYHLAFQLVTKYQHVETPFHI
jgi:hypothetical protein